MAEATKILMAEVPKGKEMGPGKVVIRGIRVGPLGATTALTSPAVGDGAMYVGSGAGLHAIDPKTRQELWRLKTSQPVAATPVVRDGVIYFVTAAAMTARARGPIIVGGDIGKRLLGKACLHAVRLKAKE